MAIPSIFNLHDLFFDENQCLQRLYAVGAFYQKPTCEDCGSAMEVSFPRQQFRCPKGSCRKGITLRTGTFFDGSKLPCSKILLMGYLWVTKASVLTVTAITGHSNNTVTLFRKHFRQLVSSNLNEEQTHIGGDGVIVEIDETKLGRRKYHRGHRVEGVWILGGVERTQERRVFMVPVENRSAATLLDVIVSHVKPGSIIYTDMWRGYAGLEKVGGYSHMTVNHSLHFSDPFTGVDTNKVEATWNALKKLIPPRNRVRYGIEDHLFEFVWRRQNVVDPWNAFLDAIKDVHYTITE